MTRLLLHILTALAGVVGVALVVHFVGPSELARVVSEIGPGAFLAVTGTYIVFLLLHTVSWIAFLRGAGHRVPFRPTFVAMLIAYAVDYLTPSAYLGGEPVRALYLAERAGIKRRRVLGTVILQKFAEFSGFMVLILVCAVVTVVRFEIPWTVHAAVFACLAVFVACYILLTVSFVKDLKLSVRFLRWLARLGIKRRALLRLSDQAREMETVVHQGFVDLRASSIVGLVFGMVGIVPVYVRPAVFFAFLDPPLLPSLAVLSLIFLLLQLVQVLQITPGGLGLVEAGLVGIFALAKLEDGLALGYAAAIRAADVVLVGAGALAGVHYGVMRAALRGEAGTLTAPPGPEPAHAPPLPSPPPPSPDGGGR